MDYTDSDEDPTGQAYLNTQKVSCRRNMTATRADSLQHLTFYELDLGLNHVVRKWSEPTDRRANMLVQGASNAIIEM
jgi:splicing factor 3B subunit 3